VKVKLTVPLLCGCALLGKAVSEMTYIVSGGTLNPTHSLTHSLQACLCVCLPIVPLDIRFSLLTLHAFKFLYYYIIIIICMLSTSVCLPAACL